MKRHRGWGQIIAISVLCLLWASSSRAAPPGAFQWSDNFGGYVDQNCPGNFEVRLFQFDDFGGAKVKACSQQPVFCDVELTGDGGCNWPLWNESANDRIGSMKVLSLPAGRCIVIYKNANWGGSWTSRYEGNYADLGSFYWEVSSMRLGCA